MYLEIKQSKLGIPIQYLRLFAQSEFPESEIRNQFSCALHGA
jgi:hypothetical protein